MERSGGMAWQQVWAGGEGRYGGWVKESEKRLIEEKTTDLHSHDFIT